MIVIHIETVLKVTNPRPFSYTGKKGLVAGFESFITGETAPDEPGAESTGLAKVQVRAATVELLTAKLESFKVKVGHPVQIKLRLFDVGQNEMYSVNAA